jgi:DNA end-binding protein Ku
MRAIWKGTISFGLVSIPIALYPATQRDDLKFRLLRKSDLSPVNYKRVAEADGKEVSWEDIVKGYEYEKGKFVVIKEEDFKRVDIEATQTVEIQSFVKLDEINPVLFYKPYYLEAEKGGDKGYVLLRDALMESGRIGIAKVVIKSRQHLAAIKPQQDGLMLELMHFPGELVDVSEFKTPAIKSVGKKEQSMAKQLVESMSDKWNPDAYKDDYREALEKMIEDKIEHGGGEAPAPARRTRPSKAVDLVSVLQESIRASRGRHNHNGHNGHARSKRRKAAH